MSNTSSSASTDSTDETEKTHEDPLENPEHPLYSPTFKTIRLMAEKLPTAEEIMRAGDAGRAPKARSLSSWAATKVRKGSSK